MFGPAVRVPTDASAASWIPPALGPFGTVGGLAPQGFEHYVLLDYRGTEAPGWKGATELLAELSRLLGSHTSSPDHCWFSIWEGYGFGTSMTLIAVARPEDVRPGELERERQRLREDDLRRNAEVQSSLRALPVFDLPNRRYYLVEGPVTAASRIEQPHSSLPQPPDLWWPQDRQWFVAGDTDLDWCYIASSHTVIDALRVAFPGRTHLVDWNATNAAAGAAGV